MLWLCRVLFVILAYYLWHCSAEWKRKKCLNVHFIFIFTIFYLFLCFASAFSHNHFCCLSFQFNLALVLWFSVRKLFFPVNLSLPVVIIIENRITFYLCALKQDFNQFPFRWFFIILLWYDWWNMSSYLNIKRKNNIQAFHRSS